MATGETHSVREFCELAFAHAGLPLTWEGEGIDERGTGPDGRVLVRVSPRYFRPSEVALLIGDPAKARDVLGWNPSVRFGQLVALMVETEMIGLQNEQIRGST